MYDMLQRWGSEGGDPEIRPEDREPNKREQPTKQATMSTAMPTLDMLTRGRGEGVRTAGPVRGD